MKGNQKTIKKSLFFILRLFSHSVTKEKIELLQLLVVFV